jgi:hypothetical protein
MGSDAQASGPVGHDCPVEPLTHNAGNAATGGIWRVDRAGTPAVLKIARPPAIPPNGAPGWQTSSTPTHWNYWRRESIAYATGFAACAYADAGIAAPELLELETRPDGSIALWLADVTGPAGFSWSTSQLAGFARRLGRAQAGWVGRIPADPWLSRRWLRQYLDDRPIAVDVPWTHPAGLTWPASVRAGLATLWQRRAELLTVAESAPRTLCHLDVWPSNLIGAEATPTLLDWAFVGEGAVGEDIANLIVDSVADGILDSALLPEIADGCTQEYLAGLREGGWRGRPEEVRRAIAATGAAKYSWLAPRMLHNAARGAAPTDANYGRHTSIEDVFAKRAPIMALLLDWAESTLA